MEILFILHIRCNTNICIKVDLLIKLFSQIISNVLKKIHLYIFCISTNFFLIYYFEFYFEYLIKNQYGNLTCEENLKDYNIVTIFSYRRKLD